MTFPKSERAVPASLNLLKPGHYALLAYWIYFRPIALKCYVYQSLPELYDPDSSPTFLKRWGNPAYWNLFFMAPIVSFVLAVCLGLPMSLLGAWIVDAPIHLDRWFDGLMFGVAVGVTFGVAFGIVGRVLGGPALGTLLGAMFGITIGALGGTTMSAALGITFTNLTDAAVVVSAIFGIMGGMAVPLDIEIGVAVSLTFLIIGAMSFGAEFVMFKIFGARFGALLARGMMSGAFVAGAFRLLFYPFEFGLALFSPLPAIRHPLEWDTLIVLPLPWTRWLLLKHLRQDEKQGLHFIASVWQNLFCRPAIQVVLYRYLQRHANPLRLFYHLLTDSEWDTYMLIPITPQQWKNNISTRRVLLGEFALRPVEATHNPRFRRSSWWLNLHLYPRSETPLTTFAGMLYDLLEPETVRAETFDLSRYADAYTSLSPYPGGLEIAYSFEALTKFLAYTHLSDLADAETVAANIESNLPVYGAIRETVLTAILRLGQIGGDIAVYRQAAESSEELTALARATGDLNELNDGIIDKTPVPERFLLERIVHHWQHMIMSEIGVLGKADTINIDAKDSGPQSETDTDVHDDDSPERHHDPAGKPAPGRRRNFWRGVHKT